MIKSQTVSVLSCATHSGMRTGFLFHLLQSRLSDRRSLTEKIMTKTIRATDCLVVVLSSLMLGCASNLPELPLDAPYNPGPTQQVASVAPDLIAPLPVPGPALSGEVIFEETRVDSGFDTFQEATVDSSLDTFQEATVDNSPETFQETIVENVITPVVDTGVVNSVIDEPLVFIANDLVQALSFIGGMEPNRTTISSPASASEFDTMVKNSMLQQGYQFSDRRVRGSQQLTTSFLEVDKNSQLSELTAIMALNSVLIRRTYLITNDIVEPSTSYIIRGIDPELVDINDQIRTL